MTVTLTEHLKTNPIHMKRSLWQVDTITPKLSTLALEDLLKSIEWNNKGICINGRYLNNLRFADDVVLIASNWNELQSMKAKLNETSQQQGIKMNLFFGWTST